MSVDHEAGQCRRRRGRPRAQRSIREGIDFRCYQPACDKGGHGRGSVTVDPAEMEAMRLVDLVGMDQESAASAIGISRKTLWRDLHEGRRKITEALVQGKSIRISECRRGDGDDCPHFIVIED